MKIRRIEHKDGSFSFMGEGITIIKGKEEKKEQTITEVDFESPVKAMKEMKKEKKLK